MTSKCRSSDAANSERPKKKRKLFSLNEEVSTNTIRYFEKETTFTEVLL